MGESSTVALKSAVAEWRGFWFLPFAAALGYATSVLHVYSLGPFIKALQQDFGWSRAQASAGLTVAALISAAACIPVGMVVDRLGPRRVGLIGVLVMSGAFALLSTATGQMANWLALWGVVAVGTFGVQATVWTSAVASRFETSRGLAFAITLCGASIAATVFPIFATWLIGSYGWRTAFITMAGIWAALVFPTLLLLFRGAQDEKRQAHATKLDAARARQGVSFADGMRSPVLYKLLMAAGFFAASLIGIFSIVGRLGTGVLLDKFRAHLVGAVAFLIPIVACTLLLFDGARAVSQAVAAAIFGLTVGSEVDVIAYLAAKHFGLKNFGALYGVLQMALAFGTAFGPLAAGSVFDHYESYAPFLVLTIVLMAASALALVSLGPTPTQVTAASTQ